MLKWLAGKLLLQNFRRDLRYAQHNLDARQARRLCEFLLRHTYAVKRARSLDHDAQLLVENEVSNILSDLPSGWLSRLQPDTVAMAVLDDWLASERAASTELLDRKLFRLIDDEVWSFVKDRLKPQEIETIQVEVAERETQARRRGVEVEMEDLIEDVSGMSDASNNAANKPSTASAELEKTTQRRVLTPAHQLPG